MACRRVTDSKVANIFEDRLADVWICQMEKYRDYDKKGIVTLADIREVQPDLSIWKGDITRLGVGAIVNAANSGMTGCYQPCHNCIDNCIIEKVITY